MVVGAGGGLRVFHMGGPVVAGIIGRHLDLVTANRAGPGIGRQVPGQIYDRCSARIGGEVPGGGGFRGLRGLDDLHCVPFARDIPRRHQIGPRLTRTQRVMQVLRIRRVLGRCPLEGFVGAPVLSRLDPVAEYGDATRIRGLIPIQLDGCVGHLGAEVPDGSGLGDFSEVLDRHVSEGRCLIAGLIFQRVAPVAICERDGVPWMDGVACGEGQDHRVFFDIDLCGANTTERSIVIVNDLRGYTVVIFIRIPIGIVVDLLMVDKDDFLHVRRGLFQFWSLVVDQFGVLVRVVRVVLVIVIGTRGRHRVLHNRHLDCPLQVLIGFDLKGVHLRAVATSQTRSLVSPFDLDVAGAESVNGLRPRECDREVVVRTGLGTQRLERDHHRRLGPLRPIRRDLPPRRPRTGLVTGHGSVVTGHGPVGAGPESGKEKKRRNSEGYEVSHRKLLVFGGGKAADPVRVRSAAVIPHRTPGRPPRSMKVPRSRKKCTPAAAGNPGSRARRPLPHTESCPHTYPRSPRPRWPCPQSRAEPPRHPGRTAPGGHPQGTTRRDPPPAVPGIRRYRAVTCFIKGAARTRSPEQPTPPA